MRNAILDFDILYIMVEKAFFVRFSFFSYVSRKSDVFSSKLKWRNPMFNEEIANFDLKSVNFEV